MSRLLFHLHTAKTPDANPRTLMQFLTPTNQRALILGLEVMPLGATSATAPIVFEWYTQTDTGTSATPTPVKDPPEAPETIQTTARDNYTVEPTPGVHVATFSIHQQTTRFWVPPNGVIVIPGNTRMGLLVLGNPSYEIQVVCYLEE